MVQKTFATWKRPSATNDNHGPAFKARPIKHWRKQLHSGNKSKRSSVGMPMDRPGGAVLSDGACVEGVHSEYARVNHTKSVCHITRQASTVVGPVQKWADPAECEKCAETYAPRGATSSSARTLKVKDQALRYEKDKPTFIMNTPCARQHRRGHKTLCF